MIYYREEAYCKHCGHRWILLSNKPIDDKLYKAWIYYILNQHFLIQLENNKKENKDES